MPATPASTARAAESSTAGRLRATARTLLDLLFPWTCAVCGEAAAALCPACTARILWLAPPTCVRCGIPLGHGPDRACGRCLERPPPFARARALAFYRSASDEETDPLGAAIRAFKYGRRRALGAPLAALLAERFPYGADEINLVVPVPLHLGRLRERGFNQALLLARGPASRFRLCLDATSLRRVRSTAPQVGLDERERRRNLRDVFRVERPERVRGRRILLVDDVVTSTATAEACATALLAAGADSVSVLSLARTALR